MAAAQDGDREAYVRLLRELDALLTPYFRRRVRSADAAADVTQETLMSVHSSRHTYDPAKPFLPWAFAIARCRLVDYWRRQQRHSGSEPLEEMLEMMEPGTASNPAASLAGEALALLSQADRDLIRFLKIEGLSLREAAARMKLTEAAVKVRAHRAYRRLRDVFYRIANEDR